MVGDIVKRPIPGQPGKYRILDGHLRIEALRQAGYTDEEIINMLPKNDRPPKPNTPSSWPPAGTH